MRYWTVAYIVRAKICALEQSDSSSSHFGSTKFVTTALLDIPLERSFVRSSSNCKLKLLYLIFFRSRFNSFLDFLFQAPETKSVSWWNEFFGFPMKIEWCISHIPSALIYGAWVFRKTCRICTGYLSAYDTLYGTSTYIPGIRNTYLKFFFLIFDVPRYT